MLSTGPNDRELSVLAGRTLNPDERCFGVVIFYADSEGSASELMAKDPAVRESAMKKLRRIATSASLPLKY